MTDRPTTRAGDFLALSARRSPDLPCFVFDDGSHRTFAETNSRVNRLACALAARGVGHGDRVAILAADSGQYAEVLPACLKLGATYVPLNNRLTEPEVSTLLGRARPRAVFAGPAYQPVAARLRDTLDGDGYLHLEGRRTDMIIRGGENVYPVEIETVLSSHPSVGQVAVIGRPDDHWGEIVVAYVVPAPGRDVDPDALRTHCRAALASYKVPAAVEVVDAMPLNASGKILKRELRTVDAAAPAGEGA